MEKKISEELYRLSNFLKEDIHPRNLELLWEDQISGGLADQKNPKDFDSLALAKGVWVEREHTDDFNKALEISMDHLVESPQYYDELEKMEEKLEEEAYQLNPLRARRDYGS